jgi:membrane-associated protease RseP (regulator of RpoE activity)
MSVVQSLLANKWTILFYGAIILLLYIYRKRFDRQGIVLLYRTKWGLKLMNKVARRHEKFIRNLAYVGIFVGYAGMVLIVGFLFYGLYQLLFVPNSLPPIQPVIPGVAIPGSPIKVPLIIGWIALFLAAVIHEFSHGVVSRAHGIKVKSSGFAFIGPLAAAFVEPDEKQVMKKKRRVGNSIFAAGPFANVILALIALLVLAVMITPAINAYLTPQGVTFQSVQKDYPAEKAGLKSGVIYTMVDGKNVTSVPEFLTALENVTPNQTVVIGTAGESHTLVTTANPSNQSRGYIGVIGPATSYTNEKTVLGVILIWVYELFNWIFLISLGLGLANLMPLGPVDGGRLFQTASEKFFGKKKGNKIWGYVTIIFIGLLIVLFFPIIKATFLALLKLLRIIP